MQTEEPREVCDCATYAGPEDQPRVYEYETEPDKKICQISPRNQYNILYYEYKVIRLEVNMSTTVHCNGHRSPLLLRLRFATTSAILLITIFCALGVLAPSRAYGDQHIQQASLPSVLSAEKDSSGAVVPSQTLVEAVQLRAKNAQVLDTYYYFMCYVDPAHDNSLYLPTYRLITFTNSFTRIYPDEQLETRNIPCLVDPSHYGGFSKFKCHYEIF